MSQLPASIAGGISLPGLPTLTAAQQVGGGCTGGIPYSQMEKSWNSCWPTKIILKTTLVIQEVTKAPRITFKEPQASNASVKVSLHESNSNKETKQRCHPCHPK